MNWDDTAYEFAEARSGEYFGCLPEQMFEHGAKWQRDQLRTNEAIERVAQAIGEWEPDDWDNPEFREDRAFWTDRARTAINALLGED